MEVKSFVDCLNFIDNMILYNIEKCDSMSDLEKIRDYILDDFNNKNEEEMVPLSTILHQINLILDRFYLPNDYDITNCYCDLRRNKLVWLEECKNKKESIEKKTTNLIYFNDLDLKKR